MDEANILLYMSFSLIEVFRHSMFRGDEYVLYPQRLKDEYAARKKNIYITLKYFNVIEA